MTAVPPGFRAKGAEEPMEDRPSRVRRKPLIERLFSYGAWRALACETPEFQEKEMDFAAAYLENARRMARFYKGLAERAMRQVGDDGFFAARGEEDNSIAVIVKHMAGNLRSRWTDFLATDGEKPDRHRDGEFVAEGETRESITAAWEAGWQALLGTLDVLGPDDLARTVHIRGEPHGVIQAVDRGLLHAAYHVGQIVLLAKHAAGPAWQTLSIARNRSAEFNARQRREHASCSDVEAGHGDDAPPATPGSASAP